MAQSRGSKQRELRAHEKRRARAKRARDADLDAPVDVVAGERPLSKREVEHLGALRNVGRVLLALALPTLGAYWLFGRELGEDAGSWFWFVAGMMVFLGLVFLIGARVEERNRRARRIEVDDFSTND